MHWLTVIHVMVSAALGGFLCFFPYLSIMLMPYSSALGYRVDFLSFQMFFLINVEKNEYEYFHVFYPKSMCWLTVIQVLVSFALAFYYFVSIYLTLFKFLGYKVDFLTFLMTFLLMWKGFFSLFFIQELYVGWLFHVMVSIALAKNMYFYPFLSIALTLF